MTKVTKLDNIPEEGGHTAIINVPFKRAKALVLPTLKIEAGSTHYLKANAAIFKGKQSDEKDSDGNLKKPVDILQVTNLETGEEMQMVVGKVLLEILNENYPAEKIVGKKFEIVKGEQKGSGSKKYFPYFVYEIE